MSVNVSYEGPGLPTVVLSPVLNINDINVTTMRVVNPQINNNINVRNTAPGALSRTNLTLMLIKLRNDARRGRPRSTTLIMSLSALPALSVKTCSRK